MKMEKRRKKKKMKACQSGKQSLPTVRDQEEELRKPFRNHSCDPNTALCCSQHNRQCPGSAAPCFPPPQMGSPCNPIILPYDRRMGSASRMRSQLQVLQGPLCSPNVLSPIIPQIICISTECISVLSSARPMCSLLITSPPTYLIQNPIKSP